MTRAVMALSGGMDSTALLINLISKGHKVSCISYDYGQKHAIELERAKMNIDYLYSNGHHIDHRVVDLTSAMEIFRSALTSIDMRVPEGHYEAEQMKQTVVPNRNAIFASILYGFAISEATKWENSVIIGLGVHSGDHEIYPDCRPEFYEALQEAFALGNCNLAVSKRHQEAPRRITPAFAIGKNKPRQSKNNHPRKGWLDDGFFRRAGIGIIYSASLNTNSVCLV